MLRKLLDKILSRCGYERKPTHRSKFKEIITIKEKAIVLKVWHTLDTRFVHPMELQDTRNNINDNLLYNISIQVEQFISKEIYTDEEGFVHYKYYLKVLTPQKI